MADVELRRVAAFTAVLRAAAGRAVVGVNFVPGTANLSRVVEMSALCAALHAAYPELAGHDGPPDGIMRREVAAAVLEQSAAREENCCVRCTPAGAAALLPWPTGRPSTDRLSCKIITACLHFVPSTLCNDLLHSCCMPWHTVHQVRRSLCAGTPGGTGVLWPECGGAAFAAPPSLEAIPEHIAALLLHSGDGASAPVTTGSRAATGFTCSMHRKTKAQEQPNSHVHSSTCMPRHAQSAGPALRKTRPVIPSKAPLRAPAVSSWITPAQHSWSGDNGQLLRSSLSQSTSTKSSSGAPGAFDKSMVRRLYPEVDVASY